MQNSTGQQQGEQQDGGNWIPAAAFVNNAGGSHVALGSTKSQGTPAPMVLPPSWHGPDLQLISQVPQAPDPHTSPATAVQPDPRLAGSSAGQLQTHGSMDLQSIAALAAPCPPNRQSGAGISRMFVRNSGEDDDSSSVHSTGSNDITHPSGTKEQAAGLIAVGADGPGSRCGAPGIRFQDADADAVQSLYKPLPQETDAVQQVSEQQHRPATTLDPEPGPVAMSVSEDQAAPGTLQAQGAARGSSPAAEQLLRHLRSLANRQASAHYSGMHDVLHAASASAVTRQFAAAPTNTPSPDALPQEHTLPASRPRQPLTNLATEPAPGPLCQSMPAPPPGATASGSQQRLHVRQLSASHRLGVMELQRTGSLPPQWSAEDPAPQLKPHASADPPPQKLPGPADSSGSLSNPWASSNHLMPVGPTMMDPISLPQLHVAATASLGHQDLYFSAIEGNTFATGNVAAQRAPPAAIGQAHVGKQLPGQMPGTSHAQGQGSDTPQHLSGIQALEAALSTGGVVVPITRSSMDISMPDQSQHETLNPSSSRNPPVPRGPVSGPPTALARHGPATWPLGAQAGTTSGAVPAPMQQQQQQQIILPTLDLSQPSQTHSQSQQDLQRVLAENLNLQLRHHMLMRQYRPVLQRTNIVMKIPWAEPSDIATDAVDALFTEITDRSGWQGVDARVRAGCIELQLTLIRAASAAQHAGRSTLCNAPATSLSGPLPFPDTSPAAMQVAGTGSWNAATAPENVITSGSPTEPAEGIAVSDILQGLRLTRLQPAGATVQLQVEDTVQQLQFEQQQGSSSSWVPQPGPVLPPKPATRIAHIEPAVLQCSVRAALPPKPAVAASTSPRPSADSRVTLEARIVCAAGTGWELRSRCRGQSVPISYSITCSRSVPPDPSVQSSWPSVQEVELDVSVHLDSSIVSQAGLAVLELWTRGGRLLSHWHPLVILPPDAPAGAFEELRDALALLPAQEVSHRLDQAGAEPACMQEQHQQLQQAGCSAGVKDIVDGLALDLGSWLEYDAMRQASAAECWKAAAGSSTSRDWQSASARKANGRGAKARAQAAPGSAAGTQPLGRLPLARACASPDHQKLMRCAGISLASHFVLCGMRASADMVMQGLLHHEPLTWLDSHAPASLHHPTSHGAGLRRQLYGPGSNALKSDNLLSDLQKAGLLYNAVRSANPDMVQLIASWGTLHWGAGAHSGDTPLQLATELYGAGSDMVTAVTFAMQNPTPMPPVSVHYSFAAPASDVAPHAASAFSERIIRQSISAASCIAHFPLSQLGTSHLSDSVIPLLKDMAQRAADIPGVHSEPYCRAGVDTSTSLRHVLGDVLSHRRQAVDDCLRGIVYVGGAMSTPTSYAAAHLLPSNARNESVLHSRGQHCRSGTAGVSAA